MKALLRTFRYLKPYLWMSVAALLALLISTAGNLAIPAVSQYVIDAGIAQQQPPVLLRGGLMMVGIALVRALFSFLQGHLSAKVSQGVAYDLRNQLYEKIQRLSFSYHDQSQTGQLLTRVTSDVELIHSFLGSALLQSLGALVMLVGSFVLMFIISLRTALVLLALGPVAVGVFAFFFTKARPLFTKAQQRLEALNITLQENLVGVRVVRAFVRRAFEMERFAARNEAVMAIQLKIGRIIAFAIPLVFLIANLATLGVTWVGGIQVINDQMTVGALVALSNYILMAIFPVFMLSFLLANMAQAAAGAQRIFEILDAHIEIQDQPDAQPLTEVRGRVTFDQVGFRYFEHQPWILQKIDFEAPPGHKVALLGATGSGKSTIINLIPRFYDATQGRVLIDGRDVREMALDSLRRQVGIVLQETLLFTGTIRENITFGRPAATIDEVVAAAKAAQAHDFISALPVGYEAPVGERGVNLSGGQKQRLAIARALLVDPRILIMDDAMSNVDYQTETKLQRALDHLMAGRTSFVIAQRVSTVRDADLILVLDEGEIVARGQHAQLLETSPIYAELYYTQLEGAEMTREGVLVYDELSETAPEMEAAS